MKNPFTLEGKTILVTGASSGIGKATAELCAGMGARVIINGRNEERLNATLAALEGEGHKAIAGDLTQQETIDEVVNGVEKLNGLVLCAGKGDTTPIPFNTREKYDAIFGINLFSPIELLRMLVKRKKFEKKASVVFVSSIGGNIAFTPGNGIYGASKAALSSTMKFAALELSSKSIRVNSVNPGMVETPLICSGVISPEQHQADMKRYPLKRYGKPDDIANGIAYLLSDASSWVTGHQLVIDGGATI